jgi:CO dehydrogenase maturation factor
MKLAITGKGGVGKSTLAAALSLLLAEREETVVAVDADPDANLASALGIEPTRREAIVPIARQERLIEERTGARAGQFGQVFRMNPDVSDITTRYAVEHRGVSLLVLGAVERGGGGCACLENVLLKALVAHLVLGKGEHLILDMEAGVEHLGRATATGVDTMIVVVEPGRRSIDTAKRVLHLAADIGLQDVRFVGNKVTGPDDEAFLRQALPAKPLPGMIPFNECFRKADREGVSVLDGVDGEGRRAFEEILANAGSAG